jgi:hypothetical protein
VTEAVVFLAQWAVLIGIGWLAPGRMEHPAAERLARAHLTGAALLAMAVHALLAAGLETPPVWGAGVLAFAGATCLFVVRQPGRVLGVRPAPPSETALAEIAHTAWPKGLLWVLRALMLLGLGTMIARLVLLPTDWDGWAIWSMKAMALSQGNLQSLLADPLYYYSHQDYPLLVPAHTWWLSGGGFSEKTGQAGGLIFALDLLVLVYYHLRKRGQGPAAAACVLVLSWATFAKHSVSGFADVPMAAYALATCLALREGRVLELTLFLIGALLTKNEGLFALAAGAGAWLLSPSMVGARGGRWRPAAAVAMAAALAVLPWMWVKRRWGAGSDLLDPSQWVLGEIATRGWVIAQGFLRQALAVGPQYPGWGLLWPATALCAVTAVRHRLRETGVYWLFVLTFLAGAVAAYLVTPLDPALHLDRSVDRLWLHIAPIAVIAVVETLTAVGGVDPAGSERPAREISVAAERPRDG